MKNILIGSLSLFLLASCKKEIKELPPPTETGANTFGAKVNGTLWAPQGFGSFPANDILEARLAGPTEILINARNFASSPNETEFEILIAGISGTGTFQLSNNVPRGGSLSYGYYVKRNMTPLNEWITSSTQGGTVTVTKFDLTNRIIAGTFQFTANNLYNTPELLTVTEGRFDLKFE